MPARNWLTIIFCCLARWYAFKMLKVCRIVRKKREDIRGILRVPYSLFEIK